MYLSGHCLCLCICLCHCIFLGQVMSTNRPDQTSKRTQVSRIALWRCSLNVFVIVIVFVCLFVFVIAFLLVSSCLLIILIKCLKGYKFLISLCEGVLLMYLSLSLSLSVYMSLSLSFFGQVMSLITLIKCLKVHKYLGSPFEGVL